MEWKSSKTQDYQLIREIDRGTYGHVIHSKRKKDDSDVAIKIISKKFLERNNISVKAKREFEVLLKFNHPNIMKIYDVFYTENNLNLVFEYCDSGDLQELIDSAKISNYFFSEKFIKSFLLSVCNAFKYIYDNVTGPSDLFFVHRDLKPKNILIHQNVIKIADFGQARFYGENEALDLTQDQGTTPYMSPETLNGRTYSFKTDVWSAGIIAYELAYNENPYPSFKNQFVRGEIIEKDGKINFPTFPNRSESLKNIIRKMLSKNPEERPDFKQLRKEEYLNWN